MVSALMLKQNLNSTWSLTLQNQVQTEAPLGTTKIRTTHFQSFLSCEHSGFITRPFLIAQYLQFCTFAFITSLKLFTSADTPRLVSSSLLLYQQDHQQIKQD
jgi:hypothetical protein